MADVEDHRFGDIDLDWLSFAEKMLGKYDENEPRDELGRWTDGGGDGGAGDSGSAGVEFVSPNVASNLNFHEAATALKGDQQQALKDASEFIDKGLGIEASHHDIIGAWADGAENSVASIIPTSGWDSLRVSAAMKGYLADQKAVLVFQQGAGDNVLYSFDAKGKLADIHENLIKDGIAFHTLMPTKEGATVLVADLDGSAKDAVKKGAARYDAEVTGRIGKAEFIGTTQESGTEREQRDSARSVYAGVIDQSKVQGVEETWRSVLDRWGEKGIGAKPPAPKGEPQNNKIPHDVTPDEKVAQLVKLTAENKPIIDKAIAEIDAQYGAHSSSDIKKPDRIKSKAERPSVLAAKPWFDVEYIRDSLRFKSVVDTFADTKAIVDKLESSGDFKVIKYDVTKVTNPKEWGWRVLPIDLQMKNGQMVEYYMVSKDQAAVAKEGHAIFEKWRNLDAAKFTPDQVKEYQKDLVASQKLNGDAWQAYKDRTGQSESDFLASVTRALTSSKSRIR